MTIMYPGPQFRDKVLIFVCLRGFRLVGRSSLYCDGRQWSADPPVCVEQPSTTLSVLLHSSTASTPAGDDVAVVLTRPPSLLPFTLHFPTSPFNVLPTRMLTRAPAVISTDVIGDSGTSTSRYLIPASFSTPSSLGPSAAGMSTPPAGPGNVVTQRRRNTGVTLTSSDVAAATSHLPTLSSSNGVSFNNSYGSVSLIASTSSVHGSSLTPNVVSSTDDQSGLPLHTETASYATTDTPLTNDTGRVRVSESSDEHDGGGKLLLYAAIAGSCAVALVVVGAACCMAVHRREPTFRRYQPMDGEDEMQAVAAAAGRSTFFATQYATLTSSSLNDEQQNSSLPTQHFPSNDDCSFV